MTKQEAIAEKEKLQQRIAELDKIIYDGFPIGTKVKIIDCLYGHEFKIGEEVEIVECENTDFLAENIRGDRWYIQTSEFVPA